MTIDQLQHHRAETAAAIGAAQSRVAELEARAGHIAAPRLPVLHRPSIEVALLTAVVGADLAAPEAAAESAHAAATAAIRDLEAHRPGVEGSAWREAEKADATDLANGVTPKKWRLAALRAGDDDRWATATAACGAYRIAQQRAKRDTDREAIAARADLVAEARAGQWAKAAADGWAALPDRLEAGHLYGAAADAHAAYRAARRVYCWAAGVPVEEHTLEDDARTLPPDPVGRGHYLALRDQVDPTGGYLGQPRGSGDGRIGSINDARHIENVIWPDKEAERTYRNSIEQSTQRLLDLRTKGYHEKK